MSSTTSLGGVDPVTIEDLTALAARTGGPFLSALLPTHRSGPATLQDPKRLRNLLDRAEELGAPRDVIRPLRAIQEDDEFWQHQAEGLAIFAGAGWSSLHRLPVAPAEEVHVGTTFRVRPILSLVAAEDAFRILALSQNEVRLFDAGRYRVDELDLSGVPTSLAEALADEEHDPRIHRAAAIDGQFHGHGSAEEQDNAELERYFRAVDHALHEHLGVSDVPLVLASVAYYRPIFAAVSTAHPRVVDRVVEGNPERRSPEELHADAWTLVEPVLAAGPRSAWKRYQGAVGTGLTATDLPSAVLAAAQGRVDVLFVAPGGPVAGSIDLARALVHVAAAESDGAGEVDLVDGAILDTIRHGGRVVAARDGQLPDDVEVTALLRY